MPLARVNLEPNLQRRTVARLESGDDEGGFHTQYALMQHRVQESAKCMCALLESDRSRRLIALPSHMQRSRLSLSSRESRPCQGSSAPSRRLTRSASCHCVQDLLLQRSCLLSPPLRSSFPICSWLSAAPLPFPSPLPSLARRHSAIHCSRSPCVAQLARPSRSD